MIPFGRFPESLEAIKIFSLIMNGRGRNRPEIDSIHDITEYSKLPVYQPTRVSPPNSLSIRIRKNSLFWAAKPNNISLERHTYLRETGTRIFKRLDRVAYWLELFFYKLPDRFKIYPIYSACELPPALF